VARASDEQDCVRLSLIRGAVAHPKQRRVMQPKCQVMHSVLSLRRPFQCGRHKKRLKLIGGAFRPATIRIQPLMRLGVASFRYALVHP
jgi:hypothetical protein